MRVLADVNLALPRQRGGSEVALHRLVKALLARGHEVRVLCTRNQGGRYDGVDYIVAGPLNADHWKWADVVVTQQAATCRVVAAAVADGNRPVVHLVHNHHWFAGHVDVLRPGADVVVWNTEALAAEMAGVWSGRSSVCRPLVWPGDWSGVTPGSRVTQINVADVKGGKVALRLAELLPDVLFQFVEGAWGGGLHVRRWPANVLYRPGVVEDVKIVFGLTKVLIAPTQQVADNQVGDSYGLSAVEALCAGIPAVVTDAPGAREALGDAGVFLPHDDVDAWRDAVRTLATDEIAWADARARCAEQARVVAGRSAEDVDRFEKLLAEVA